MVKFLAEVRADPQQHLRPEVAEPAKWLLKEGRNTYCFSWSSGGNQMQRIQIKSK